jgi:hypothetical protein
LPWLPPSYQSGFEGAKCLELELFVVALKKLEMYRGYRDRIMLSIEKDKGTSIRVLIIEL